MYERWKREAPSTVFVDGDEIRRIFQNGRVPQAYSIEGRTVAAERIFEMCAWLDRQKTNVVCATLSSVEETRRKNRETFSDYFEVYVSTPMEVCVKRDTKNLYAPALRGELDNVVGVDIPFPTPEYPDMVFDNSVDAIDFKPIAENILLKSRACLI